MSWTESDVKAERGLRRRIRRSLHDWAVLALEPQGQVPAAHHRLMIRELEAVAHGRCDRLMLLLPPGSAKSTYASLIFPAWFMARRPRSQVIAASGLAVASDGTLAVSDLSAGTAKAAGSVAARAIGDGFADALTLRDFGAAGYIPGTGGDDLPAFSAALAKLVTLGGGRLLLPAGTFKVSGPISLPTSTAPLQLQGQGDATVLQPSAAVASVLAVNAGNLLLSDFALVNVSGFAGAGLTVAKALDNSRCEFDRLTFASFGKGVWVQNGDVLHFNRPRFVSCDTAFAVDNGMLNSSIAEMYSLGGNGIDVAVPTGQQVEGLQVIGGKILPSTTGSFGVRLRSGLEISLNGLVVDQLAAAGAVGILVDSSSAAIRAVKISNCWTGINAGTTGTGSGIKLVGAASESIHIDQHTFDSHGAYGLQVDGGAGLVLDLLVTHSRFKGNTLGDISLKACRAKILGCDLRHGTTSVATAGTQVQVIGIANRFAADPQLGTIADGFYAANVGNSNDSLGGQSIGVNLRAPVVAAATLDVQGTSVMRADLSVAGKLGIGGVLHITGAGDPEGSVAAPVASLYSRSDGIADHLLFAKRVGTGASGWEAQASQDFVARQVSTALPSVPASGLYGGSGTAGAAQPVTVSTGLSYSGGALAGALHIIKDGRGDAAANPITIPAPSGTIDGNASFVLNQNRAAVTLVYTGTEWSIV